MTRLACAMAVATLILAGATRAESPVQSDNQYDVPAPDPSDLKAQESPDEDGRFPLEVAARVGYLETWRSLVLPWERRTRVWGAELGGGAGLYLLGHDLKLQADAFALPGSDGFDARARAQVQVYF